jgi:hypothetical protein
MTWPHGAWGPRRSKSLELSGSFFSGGRALQFPSTLPSHSVYGCPHLTLPPGAGNGVVRFCSREKSLNCTLQSPGACP